MVHVRFINDQETVVTVPVRPDVDRWVLAVMPVKIKLELLRDTLGVNGNQNGRQLIRTKKLTVKKNAFDRRQGSTHKKIYLLGMLSDSPFKF